MAVAAGSGATDDGTRDAILSSVGAGVIDFGARRMTLSDGRRRAGVSRMTVHDRFGGPHDLMHAVIRGGPGRVVVLEGVEEQR